MPAKPSAIIAQVDVSGTPPVAWKLAKLAESNSRLPTLVSKTCVMNSGTPFVSGKAGLEVIRCE